MNMVLARAVKRGKLRAQLQGTTGEGWGNRPLKVGVLGRWGWAVALGFLALAGATNLP